MHSPVPTTSQAPSRPTRPGHSPRLSRPRRRRRRGGRRAGRIPHAVAESGLFDPGPRAPSVVPGDDGSQPRRRPHSLDRHGSRGRGATRVRDEAWRGTTRSLRRRHLGGRAYARAPGPVKRPAAPPAGRGSLAYGRGLSAAEWPRRPRPTGHRQEPAPPRAPEGAREARRRRLKRRERASAALQGVGAMGGSLAGAVALHHVAGVILGALDRLAALPLVSDGALARHPLDHPAGGASPAVCSRRPCRPS